MRRKIGKKRIIYSKKNKKKQEKIEQEQVDIEKIEQEQEQLDIERIEQEIREIERIEQEIREIEETQQKSKLLFICAQPDETYFHWQVKLYLHNFTKFVDKEQCYAIFGYRDNPS